MRRGAATAAIAAGIVLAAAGGGLGVPHLAESGLTAPAVVGVIVLFIGLVLAALGALVWLRSTRLWGRVAVVLVVAATTYVLAPAIAVAVAVTHVPRADLAPVTPDDIGLRYEDVRFEAADGVRLAGWYIPSENGEGIVLAHGGGSTRTSVLEHARVLANRGYGILLYDARGHGESEGQAMDLGWWGDADVAGAAAFVHGRPDVTSGRVHGVGMSMGGEQLVGALPAVPELCSVVAEGATARTAADRSWLSDAYGLRGWVQEGVDRLAYGLTDLLTSASPPRSLRQSVAEAAPRPVLLVAARTQVDEPRAAAHIAGGSPTSVTVWVVPGVGHAGALEARRGEWTDRVDEFLTAADC